MRTLTLLLLAVGFTAHCEARSYSLQNDTGMAMHDVEAGNLSNQGFRDVAFYPDILEGETTPLRYFDYEELTVIVTYAEVFCMTKIFTIEDHKHTKAVIDNGSLVYCAFR